MSAEARTSVRMSASVLWLDVQVRSIPFSDTWLPMSTGSDSHSPEVAQRSTKSTSITGLASYVPVSSVWPNQKMLGMVSIV